MSTKRVAAFLALLACLPVLAEQWEGNAARIRAGEFATPGMFAASNSFAEGTRIRVASARTGKSVEVTVTRRVNGTTGVFLLLSDQAADAIGLVTGDVERVVAATTVSVPIKDYTPVEKRKDPDDPRAGLAQLREELKAAPAAPVEPKPAAQPAAQQAVEPAPRPPAVAVVVEPAPAEPALGESVARDPQKQLYLPPQEPQEPRPAAVAQAPVVVPQPAPAPPVEPVVEPVAEAAPAVPGSLVEFLAREPQKRLFVPPREEEIAVTVAPPRPASAPARVTLMEPAPPAVPRAVVVAPEAGPEVVDGPPRVAVAPLVEPPLVSPEPPAEVAAAAPSASEGPVVIAPPPAPVPPAPAAVVPATATATAEPAAPGERPAGGLVLTPTEPRPPQGIAPPAEPRPAPVVAVAAAPLPAGDRRYVIQLAAFADEAAAREVQRKHVASFPVDVQPGARNGRSYYRVVVGPLGRDETGSMLLRFQSLGYRDAFVRAVN